MPITPAQSAAATATQNAAAQDVSPQVRLVAGPGSGKSAVIEERVRWLIANNTPPDTIYAVSFTRASTTDLRTRILACCTRNGIQTASQVRVSTLHSLALRILRAAGLLGMYPVDPLVLDDWEQENVFDEEFGHAHGVGVARRREIRLFHEAFWSTGVHAPVNYIPSVPPITAAEQANFTAFHGPRTQLYSCVLPGEIVRLCVQAMAGGGVDPVALLQIRHLIVDEFQDLNPMDLDLIHGLIAKNVTAFVAGDDDQSIYSFRFASPAGIQQFAPARYPGAGRHTLTACFRCTPRVLAAAQSLIAANAIPGRLPKNQTSLYGAAVPPVQGTVHRWIAKTGVEEAQMVAASCNELIKAGIRASEILVLASNQKALGPALEQALGAANVPFVTHNEARFSDELVGRFVLSILRVVRNADDYVAHRVLLGIPAGIGVGTCNAIADAVIANNLVYRSIFYQPLPPGVFSVRGATALGRAATTLQAIAGWLPSDTLAVRQAALQTIVDGTFGAGSSEAQEWQAFTAALVPAITLAELCDVLSADSTERATLLAGVYARIGLPVPAAVAAPDRVRLMTMHGAKGLSAKVVFIPGLEEELLPGSRRRAVAGLVLEAARMLYVSVTRARAALIMSYARRRFMNGKMNTHVLSRFCNHLNGPFMQRGALAPGEAQQIHADCLNL